MKHDVPQEWRSALSQFQMLAARGAQPEVSGQYEGPPSIYVLGSPDSGKSTFCRWVAEQMGHSIGVALLDADPGQGRIGPPTAISLCGASLHHAFVGDTSPRGSLLQFVAGSVGR